MAKLKPTQMKAIAWYAERENLRPELSTSPTIYFTHKLTKEKKTVSIDFIVPAWERWREEQKRKKKESA